jgi:hypothetical protein
MVREAETKWPGLTNYLNATDLGADPYQMTGPIGTAPMRRLLGAGTGRPNSLIVWQRYGVVRCAGTLDTCGGGVDDRHLGRPARLFRQL